MKTALVLSGGLAKGAFQVGAMKALFPLLVPDIFIGTSIGAVNAAIVLGHKDVHAGVRELERVWLHANKRPYFTVNPGVLVRFLRAPSIMSKAGLERFVREHCTDSFAELSRELYVNAFDLKTNRNVFMNSGSLRAAVVASCSMPPLYTPSELDEGMYVDGDMGNEVGLWKAEAMGCEQIVFVDLNLVEGLPKGGVLSYLLSVSERKTELCYANEIRSLQRARVIKIDITQGYAGTVDGLVNFGNAETLISLGEKNMRERIREIAV